MGLPTKVIHSIDFLSSIANQSQVKIRKVYEEALNCQPAIVIIDDIDSIASQKDSTNKESEKKVIFQLANSLDQIQNVFI